MTSYDYDAPLSEDGRTTPKYDAFRTVIARHTGTMPTTAQEPEAVSTVDAIIPNITVHATRDLAEARDAPRTVWSLDPASMDATDHYRGFQHYTAWARRGGVLTFSDVRDRAIILLDGNPIATISREFHERSALIPSPGALEVLVEDMGRVNYGPRIGEPKGLIGSVLLDDQPVRGWHSTPVVLEGDDGSLDPELARSLREEEGMSARTGRPQLLHSRFNVTTPTDLFLDTRGLGKGAAWVNGYALGRYWSRGPARTLYLPAPAIQAGRNELVVLDLTGTVRSLYFAAAADLGDLEA